MHTLLTPAYFPVSKWVQLSLLNFNTIVFLPVLQVFKYWKYLNSMDSRYYLSQGGELKSVSEEEDLGVLVTSNNVFKQLVKPVKSWEW